MQCFSYKPTSVTPRLRGRRAVISSALLRAFLPTLCLLAVGSLGMQACALAQDKSAPGTDVTQLIGDMDDIDSMRPLLPLKLTPEQLDKMAAAITASQNGYDKQLKAIAGPTLAKLAAQIRDVKQKALKGESIPKEFDASARAAEKEILTKRRTLNEDTIAALSGALEGILTPEQYKLAARLDRDAQIKLGKATATTQKTEALWFASYVTDAIFTVPRIVPLLKQMRAANDPKTAGADTSGSSAGAGK